VLWGKEFLGIPSLYIGAEPVLKADFDPKGWDWTGRRLDIRGELGQQEQRSASATPSRASSICSPQPDQVAFLQISQVTLLNQLFSLLPIQILKLKTLSCYSVCPEKDAF
jgi:hypothetical protein